MNQPSGGRIVMGPVVNARPCKPAKSQPVPSGHEKGRLRRPIPIPLYVPLPQVRDARWQQQ